VSTQCYPHQVTRIAFDTGQRYEAFRTKYEAAVPALATTRLAELIARRASWDDVMEDAEKSAPHGFFIFWRSEHTPLMTLGGDDWNATSYLMGNHVVAEQMYRHDPSAMLYAPLRTTIYTEADGTNRFAVDQPTTVFSSFDNPDIAAVGATLDQKLARLLEALDVPDSKLLEAS
jgi:hypothetical protein